MRGVILGLNLPLTAVILHAILVEQVPRRQLCWPTTVSCPQWRPGIHERKILLTVEKYTRLHM